LSSPPDSSESEGGQLDGPSSDFEALLAKSIAALAGHGPAALEALLEAHAALAPRLRERLATLQRLGMLEAPDLRPEELGSIGPYQLLGTIGRGGMSQVFLARSDEAGERVALKVLHAPFLEDPRARLRFEREVQAVAALSHPCIVRLRASGSDDGRPWFAMEFVEGASLDRVLQELGSSDVRFDELEGAHVLGIIERACGVPASRDSRRGYVESICRIVLDAAEALEHAHRFGVVHRDVKPANIIVGRDGRAKLLDLGLASLEGSPSLTRTGDFAGTPYYVAPEQANRIQEADHRADVFSLGVTLYEALTFTRPFEGRDAAEVFRNVQSREPLPPSRLNPLLPRDLETICLCALEKDPAARYQSMADLATDLQHFLEFKPVLARPVSRARKALRFARRRPSLTALALLLVVFIVAAPIVLALVNDAIRGERDLAELAAEEAQRQARISEAVVDHLVTLFAPTSGYAREEWGFEQMLEASVARIPSELQEDPLIRAALLEAAGRIHFNLDRTAQAFPLLDRAYALRQREYAAGAPALAATLIWLARAHLEADNPRAARALAARGLEAFEVEGVPDGAAFELRLTLAEAARRCGDPEAARRELATLDALCLRFADELGDRGHRVDSALAELHLQVGELGPARARAQSALARVRGAWVPDATLLAQALERLAVIDEAAGDGESAARSRSQAAAFSRSFSRAQRGPSGEAWLRAYPFELLPPWMDEFERAFQEGITALQTGRGVEAIAAFESCLRLAPDHPVCYYNLACASGVAGDREAALAWLQQAARHHFGVLQGNLEGLDKDPDLTLLHGDERFGELYRAMRREHDEAWERSAAPHLHLVAEQAGGAAPGLVVVLSGDRGATGPERFALWRDVADGCGAGLLLLEGPLAGTPLSWFGELDNFLEDPWATLRQPAAVIAAFAQEHELDPRRVLLVGEGSGAPVAFDLALRAPGFFRATLLLDGLPSPSCTEVQLSLTRVCGSRFRLLLGEGDASSWRPVDASPERIAQELGTWLASGGLEARAEAVVGRALDLPRARLVQEVSELFAAPLDGLGALAR
jgi:serine/threonine protein kinase